MYNIDKIEVSLASEHKSHYTIGGVTVTIIMKNAPFDAEDFSECQCNIYADDFFPMCSSLDAAQSDFEWPTLVYAMQSCRVWLPGKYTLYLRWMNDVLLQVPLTLTKRGHFRLSAMKEEEPLGLADIVTCSLEGKHGGWTLMASQPGTAMLRRKAMENAQIDLFNIYREGLSRPPVKENRNYLISTVNRDLDDKTLQLFHKTVGRGEMLVCLDCQTLYDVTRGNPYESLNERLDQPDYAAYCLTNVGSLLSTGGKVIVRRIVEKVRQDKRSCLWLCGLKQEVDNVLEVFPSLNDFFPRENRLEQQPYTAFEMVQAFNCAVIEAGLELSSVASHRLALAVLKAHGLGRLSGWTLADVRRFVAEDVCPRFIQRTINNLASFQVDTLEPGDLNLGRLTEGQTDFEESIRELNAMVGLDDVKQSIITVANQTRFSIERKRLGLKTRGKNVFHAIFTGNPGTGKTTVARQLGKVYHSLGLLSKGDVVAVDRTRLVGRYIGETEENMKAVLEEARGNVLFIDEAYTLYDGANDRKDFGGRVIDSLLTVLTQPDPDMLIILAGYEKEMDGMLQTNPGLMGRFPYKFRFQDYDAQQLMDIACRLLKREDYVLTDEAAKELLSTIELTLQQRTRNFGNARWVEQYISNGIIPALADRVTVHEGPVTAALYQTIEVADIRKAFEKFNPRTIELKPRRQIGFSA